MSSTKVYIGSTTVQGSLVDFHGSNVINVATPVNTYDIVHKSYVDTAVDAQKNRIDTLLASAELEFDTLKEIYDYANGIKTTDLSALNDKVANEKTRAEGAESTLTTNLSTENTRALAAETAIEKKIIKSSRMTPNIVTIPDEQAPILQPTTLNPFKVPVAAGGKSFYEGWYFTNSAAGKKINWYPQLPYTVKVKDILGVFAKTFILDNSNSSNLFLTLYTKPTGTGDKASWFKARQTWDIGTNPKPANGATLIGARNNSSFDIVSDGLHTNYQLSNISSVSADGTFQDNDEVYLISIGSDSSAAAGRVNTIVQSLHLSLATGIVEWKLYNADVQQMVNDAAAASNNIVSTGKATQSISGILTLENLNMSSHRIQNVTDGTSDQDASTYKQLKVEADRAKAAEDALANRVTALETELTKVYSFFFNTTDMTTTLTR